MIYKPLQVANRAGAGRSAVAVPAASRRWLRFLSLGSIGHL